MNRALRTSYCASNISCKLRKLNVLALGLPGVGGWQAAWGQYASGRGSLVALDADKAGDEAAETLAIELIAAGSKSVERWRPPAKDWAETLPEVAA